MTDCTKLEYLRQRNEDLRQDKKALENKLDIQKQTIETQDAIISSLREEISRLNSIVEDYAG